MQTIPVHIASKRSTSSNVHSEFQLQPLGLRKLSIGAANHLMDSLAVIFVSSLQNQISRGKNLATHGCVSQGL